MKLAGVAMVGGFLAYLGAKKPADDVNANAKALVSGNEIPDIIRGKKYPAKDHCKRVWEIYERHRVSGEGKKATAFFIAGEELEKNKYCDTDREFRQNRYFYYLTGVQLPGCAVLYNTADDKLTLFLPNVDEEDIIWSGEPLTPQDAQTQFDVDEVHHVSEIVNILKDDFAEYDIYTTDFDNIHDTKIREFLIDGDKKFFDALNEARAIKDWYEIAMIQKACEISDNSHLAVMSHLPIELTELQVQAEFAYHATRQGGKSLGYDPICCSGPACGTLHYVKNSESLEKKESFLIDAGAEWNCYTSDVTRCFPISGKFTKEHREIYNAVLDMQTQVMERIKPGAQWEDLHLLSHKVLIKHLRNIGIFKQQFSEDEIFERKVSCGFYPHGLGHMLGLDVHDTAGHANYEDDNPYFQYLRIRRKLESNMVVTNEPGCYFNEHLIEEFVNKFPLRKEVVDFDILRKYMYVGGVRIEDDILVTKSGCKNLNSIPSDPDEIEKIVQRGLNKKRTGFHVIV